MKKKGITTTQLVYIVLFLAIVFVTFSSLFPKIKTQGPDLISGVNQVIEEAEVNSNLDTNSNSGYENTGSTSSNAKNYDPVIGECTGADMASFNKYKNIIDASVANSGMRDAMKGTGFIPEAVFASLITQESGAKWDPKAVSACGSVGLNQFIAATAINYGLTISIKTDSGIKKFDDVNKYRDYIDRNNLWQQCHASCGTKVSPCNSCTKQYCDYDNDDRFKPEKSIDASAKYLSREIIRCKSLSVGIGAYNSGHCGGETNVDYTKRILEYWYPKWAACLKDTYAVS